MGALGSVYHFYAQKPLGLLVWHVGLGGLLPCLIFLTIGIYQKYIDTAWDVYF